jgi:hypothetical protein
MIQVAQLLIMKRAVFQCRGSFEFLQALVIDDVRASNDRCIRLVSAAVDPIVGMTSFVIRGQAIG